MTQTSLDLPSPERPPQTDRAPRVLERFSERSLESLALGAGAVSFVIVAILAMVAFGFQPTPISGPGSVGQFAAIASGSWRSSR